MASHILKDMILAVAPPLRRAREHIHRQNHLLEAARQDAANAMAERDEARKVVADLEAELARRDMPSPAEPSQAQLDELVRLRREVEQLEDAHRLSVELNNELLNQLPRLQRVVVE